MKKFNILLLSVLVSISISSASAQEAHDVSPALAPIPDAGEVRGTGSTATSRCLAQSPSECCLPTIDFDRPACQDALSGGITIQRRTYANPAVQKGYDLMSACLVSKNDPSQCDYKSMDKEIVEGGWVSCRRGCGDIFNGNEFVSGDNIACETVCDNQWPDSLHGDFEKAAQDAIADWKTSQTKVILKTQPKETILPKSVKEETVLPSEKTVPKPKTKEIKVPSPTQPIQQAQESSSESKAPRFQLIETFYVKFVSPLRDFFRKVFKLGG